MTGIDADITDLAAMADEDILPELEPYLMTLSEMPFIKHPLINQALPINGLVNRVYTEKKKRVAEYEENGEYGHALWLYEKPWRLDIVLMWSAAGLLDDELYRELLAQAWTDTELPHQTNKDAVVRAFQKAGFLTDGNMPPPEQPLTIFRGGNRTGLSWTMSLDKAVWFANRWKEADDQKELWQATIRPDGVLAVFWDRGESEVVVNYRKLRDRVQLDPDNPV